MHRVNYNHQTAEMSFWGGNNPIEIYFKLREGVYTHEGEEITSEMVLDVIAASYDADENTLIHKQWEPFAYTDTPEAPSFTVQGIDIINEYEFKLLPHLGNGRGWMDILYSLTQPMAGIFCEAHIFGDVYYVQGSGAYMFENFDITNGFVHLTPNAQWVLGTAPTQDVKFMFIPDDNVRWASFQNGIIDVVVAPPEEYQEDMLGVQFRATEGNPLYLIINKENTPALSDVDTRIALAKVILNESEPPQEGDEGVIQNVYANNTINPIFNNTLSYTANGVWTKDARTYSSDLNNVILEAFQENPPQLMFGYLADEKYAYMVDEIQNAFANYSIVLSRHAIQDETEYELSVDGRSWDFAIKEIDVSNLNSAYHELYGKISYDMDYMLRGTIYAANLETYALLHAQVQIKLHNDASYINLGWQRKIIANLVTVTGITFPTSGFSPTGDVSRIDFRGVTKI